MVGGCNLGYAFVDGWVGMLVGLWVGILAGGYDGGGAGVPVGMGRVCELGGMGAASMREGCGCWI